MPLPLISRLIAGVRLRHGLSRTHAALTPSDQIRLALNLFVVYMVGGILASGIWVAATGKPQMFLPGVGVYVVGAIVTAIIGWRLTTWTAMNTPLPSVE